MDSAEEKDEKVLETLASRGWRFRDPDEIGALIRTHESPSSSSPSSSSSSMAVDSIESELLNMDLRSFEGKSLPDPSSLKKSSHIQGPLILQLVSVRDTYQSSIDASFRDSNRPSLLYYTNKCIHMAEATIILCSRTKLCLDVFAVILERSGRAPKDGSRNSKAR